MTENTRMFAYVKRATKWRADQLKVILARELGEPVSMGYVIDRAIESLSAELHLREAAESRTDAAQKRRTSLGA